MFRYMSRLIQYFLIFLFSLIFFEFLGQIWIYKNNGFFPFFKHSDTPENLINSEDTRQKLSPIFGYSYRPGWRPSDGLDDFKKNEIYKQLGVNQVPEYFYLPANNYGFISNFDYPHSNKDSINTFYIAITGGSVANGLALMVQEEFEKIVKKDLGFDNHDIVIINLSNGGYKQPIQAQILSYFISIGQKIDLIINLDGLNEAYIGWENVSLFNTEYSIPYGTFLYGLLNNYYSKNPLLNQSLIKNLLHSKSAILYLYGNVLRERNKEKLFEYENEIGSIVKGRSYPIVIQKPKQKNLDDVSDEIVKSWINGSLIIKGISEKFGIKYLHALQPIQYISKKEFSESEKSMAFQDPEWQGAEAVRKIYPKMIKSANKLKSFGVNFIDLTDVFEESKEHIYFDSCCHFRKNGYEIILEKKFKPLLKKIFSD